MLAKLMLVGSAGVIALLFLREEYAGNVLLMVGPAILLGVAVSYLVIGRSHGADCALSQQSRGLMKSKLLALTCTFLLLTLVELIICGMTKGGYYRPVSFFVIASFIGAILCYEMVVFPSSSVRGCTGILLSETIVLGIILRVSPQILYPTVTGIDPWWNVAVVSDIVSSGALPLDTGYTYLPVTHGVLSSIMIVSEIDTNTSLMASGILVTVVGCLALFSVGNRLSSSRVGLIGALIFCFSDLLVQIGVWIRPISYGTLMFLCVVMAFVLLCSSRTMRFAIVLLAFGFAVVLSHVVATITTAVFLISAVFFVTLLSGRIERKRYRFTIYSHQMLAALSFVVVFVAWWAFVTGGLDQIERFASIGFSYEKWEPSSESDQYISEVIGQRVIGVLGFNLIIGVACLGIIDSLRGQKQATTASALSMSTLVIIGLLFASLVFDASGLLAARWYPLTEGLACITAAYGLVWIDEVSRRRLRRLIAPCVIFVIMILMIASPSSNYDSPFLTPDVTPRLALKTSEITAAQESQFLVGDGQEIATDYYYFMFYSEFGPMNGMLLHDPCTDVSESFVTGEIGDVTGVIAVRSEILENPFYYFGTVRASEGLGECLESVGCSRIYDVGTVRWYLSDS